MTVVALLTVALIAVGRQGTLDDRLAAACICRNT